VHGNKRDDACQIVFTSLLSRFVLSKYEISIFSVLPLPLPYMAGGTDSLNPFPNCLTALLLLPATTRIHYFIFSYFMNDTPLLFYLYFCI